MSGVVKAVKKVFKKVVKVAKKVAPIALAAGAIIFTGGAALGLTAGWGATVSSVVGSLGGTGVLSNVLTGAITYGGYGALAGGAMAGLSGGDMMKGAQKGALVGAVSGGVASGLGFGPTATAPGAAGPAGAGAGPAGPGNAAAASGTHPASEMAGIGPQANPGLNGSEFSGLPAPSGGGGVVTPTGATGAQAARGLGSVSAQTTQRVASSGATAAQAATESAANPSWWESLTGEGSFLSNNGDMVGRAVAGLGEGLMKGAGSEAEAEAMRERTEAEARLERERRAEIAGNYATGGAGLMRGLSAQQAAAGQGNPTPEQRFGSMENNGRYVYDRGTRQIVFVPSTVA